MIRKIYGQSGIRFQFSVSAFLVQLKEKSVAARIVSGFDTELMDIPPSLKLHIFKIGSERPGLIKTIYNPVRDIDQIIKAEIRQLLLHIIFQGSGFLISYILTVDPDLRAMVSQIGIRLNLVPVIFRSGISNSHP